MKNAPIDLAALQKKIDKSIPGISIGFNDPTTWMDTGCYALNYLCSGDFTGGIPLEGKFTMLAGDSGSGKSYIGTANLVKYCLANNIFPVVVDTENGLDGMWLEKFGIDTSQVYKASAATVDDLAAFLGAFIEGYKATHSGKPYKDRPRVLIIVDSLGMLITGNQEKQFMEGDQKGDMGIKAKQITALIRVAMAKIACERIGLVATNHVYDSQDQYTPDKISGGKMLEFASSLIIQMNKLLLKEDEHGVKLADGAVAGIKSSIVVRKSRYSKPFEKLKINIPYDTGMDPYSGLFELFEKKGVVTKDGARYTYTSPVDGEVMKDWRKKYKSNGWLDRIMCEWSHWENYDANNVGFDLTGSEEDDNGE